MIWLYVLIGLIVYFTVAYIVVMKLDLKIPVIVDVRSKALEIRRRIEEEVDKHMEDEQ